MIEKCGILDPSVILTGYIGALITRYDYDIRILRKLR